MPIKHNLSKYDRLRDHIHRISQKDAGSFSKEELLFKQIATLVAVFSSGNSWKTHKEFVSVSPDFNSAELRDEFLNAQELKWKNVNAFDISEVAQKDIQGCKFERWMYYNVDGNMHPEYKRAWSSFKQILDNDGMLAEETILE